MCACRGIKVRNDKFRHFIKFRQEKFGFDVRENDLLTEKHEELFRGAAWKSW